MQKTLVFEFDKDQFDFSLVEHLDTHASNDEQISSYFSSHFSKLGGAADVVISESKVTVKWTPHNEKQMDALVQELFMLLQSRHYREAEAILKGLLSSDPDNPVFLYNYGMLLSDIGRLKESISVLNSASKIDTNNANVWNALGVAYSRSGEGKKAIEALKKSIELEPENPYTLRNLGGLIAHDSLKEAIPYLEKAASTLPNDIQAQYGYGLALYETGDYTKADAILKHAVDIDPYSEVAEKSKQIRSKIAHKEMRSGPGGDVRMDVVMYCLSALKKFEASPSSIRPVTYEIAMLGMNGLDINDPSLKYTLKSQEGEFTGMQLVSFMYVGLKELEPNMDAGVDLSSEYKIALDMFKREKQG